MDGWMGAYPAFTHPCARDNGCEKTELLPGPVVKNKFPWLFRGSEGLIDGHPPKILCEANIYEKNFWFSLEILLESVFIWLEMLIMQGVNTLNYILPSLVCGKNQHYTSVCPYTIKRTDAAYLRLSFWTWFWSVICHKVTNNKRPTLRIKDLTRWQIAIARGFLNPVIVVQSCDLSVLHSPVWVC